MPDSAPPEGLSAQRERSCCCLISLSRRPGLDEKQVRQMDETCVSFYLRQNRIRVFRQTITAIGNPRFIRFMIKKDGSSLILLPYNKKTFQSLRVPKTANYNRWSMEISSKPLCLLLAHHLGWERSNSYRVPGKIYKRQPLVLFDLSMAYPIE